MTIIFGVFDPGFPDHLEACSMAGDDAAAYLFRIRGVPTVWGIPVKCVGWFDTDDNLRGAVATYQNGKQAILRFLRNGHWELTFGDAP